MVSYVHAAAPYVLFANFIYLYRINLDGTGLTRLSTYYYNYGLDFDFKYVDSNKLKKDLIQITA